MSGVEKLSKVIASKISTNLSIDKDHEEVLAYGAFALIQTLMSILVIVVFGVVFNVLMESLVISFSAAILRKFSGGEHAASPVNCALIGMIIFGGLSIFVKNIIMNIDFLYLIAVMIMAFAFTLYIMFKYSPVGCVNKPLKNQNIRKHLRRQSIVFVLSLLIINIILIIVYMKTKNIYLLSIAVCISTGIVWQSITLVSLGHLIIEKLDKTIGGIKIFKRRTN